MKATIGQKIAAAVLSEQLGISSDRAMRLYVNKQNIHPSWEAVGEALLKNSLASAEGLTVPNAASKKGGPRARAARS